MIYLLLVSLLDCPSKYSTNKKFYSFSLPSVGVKNSLFINTNRKCYAIPYVQNQVNTIPKKPNIIGTNISKDFWNKIPGLLVSLNNKTASNCNLPEKQLKVPQSHHPFLLLMLMVNRGRLILWIHSVLAMM